MGVFCRFGSEKYYVKIRVFNEWLNLKKLDLKAIYAKLRNATTENLLKEVMGGC